MTAPFPTGIDLSVQRGTQTLSKERLSRPIFLSAIPERCYFWAVKLPNIVALLAAIASLVLLALLIRARNDLMLAQAAVASLKNANADLTLRVAEMERNKLDDALVKRLLADQREAIKLRGEVTTLNKSLAAAESATAAANAAAQRLNSNQQASKSANADAPTENPYTRVFTNKAHAILPAGHGMILGGWQTGPG